MHSNFSLHSYYLSQMDEPTVKQYLWLKNIMKSNNNYHSNNNSDSSSSSSSNHIPRTSISDFVNCIFPKFNALKVATGIVARGVFTGKYEFLKKFATDEARVEALQNSWMSKDSARIGSEIHSTIDKEYTFKFIRDQILPLKITLLNDVNYCRSIEGRHLLHEEILFLESLLNGAAASSTSTAATATTSPSTFNMESIYAKFNPDLIWATEFPIYLPDLNCSGIIDAIFRTQRHDNDNLIIVDWKTLNAGDVPQIYKHINKEWGKPPFDRLAHTKFMHFSVQLNSYRAAFEVTFRKKITAMYIGILDPVAKALVGVYKVDKIEQIDYILHNKNLFDQFTKGNIV